VVVFVGFGVCGDFGGLPPPPPGVIFEISLVFSLWSLYQPLGEYQGVALRGIIIIISINLI
jgi:hypothetical protein